MVDACRRYGVTLSQPAFLATLRHEVCDVLGSQRGHSERFDDVLKVIEGSFGGGTGPHRQACKDAASVVQAELAPRFALVILVGAGGNLALHLNAKRFRLLLATEPRSEGFALAPAVRFIPAGVPRRFVGAHFPDLSGFLIDPSFHDDYPRVDVLLLCAGQR